MSFGESSMAEYSYFLYQFYYYYDDIILCA